MIEQETVETAVKLDDEAMDVVEELLQANGIRHGTVLSCSSSSAYSYAVNIYRVNDEQGVEIVHLLIDAGYPPRLLEKTWGFENKFNRNPKPHLRLLF